jgi:alcohol dehydrogenase
MSQCPDWDEAVPTELRKFVAPEFVFGIGALDRVGGYAARLGARNVTVVTDPGVIAAGWTDQALASLRLAGVGYSVFSAVSPNPRTEEVMAGAEHYRATGSDGLVAVGGGSPIDCAKGIGIVVAGNRHIVEFEGVDRVALPMPPLLCVPTTAGPSADISQFAIFTDHDRGWKFSVISKAVVADLSLIDPRCATTLPPGATAAMGVDALCHAIESFVSTGHSPFTDLYALEAARRLMRHLLPSIAAPASLTERHGVVLAGLQAGLAFSNASLGVLHAMSHAIGGRFDAPHGDCNGVLLGHVVDFNFPAAPQRYRYMATALGLAVGALSQRRLRSALTEALRTFCRQAGISGTLTDIGVRRADIPALARAALRDACVVTNPRRPSLRDIELIYEQAL